MCIFKLEEEEGRWGYVQDRGLYLHLRTEETWVNQGKRVMQANLPN